ncbi:MAG TPA: carboxypeptidase-like regulatory domain-containing protein, partial [Candidatus Ozemobacteraceae bacterium]|nr:carboxypeptidase-like regulatory domain-containing protein [Candidatus Ozemobacteraceae bacterium]
MSFPSHSRHQADGKNGTVRVSNRNQGAQATAGGLTLNAVRHASQGQGKPGGRAMMLGMMSGWLSVVLLGALLIMGCDTDNNVKSREGALSGKVVDKAGTALQYALVSWAEDRTRWGRTDANGKFVVEGVSFGTRQFVVELTGYRTRTFDVNIYSEAI